MSQPNILVADDSCTVRVLLKRILNQAGYAVTFASDGKEAIESVVLQPPALIVLDIHMPVMDGYETCQQLMSLGAPWSEIPILFLTHAEGPHLSVLGSELGAYLRKPVAPETLVPTVRRLIDRHGERRRRGEVLAV